MNSSSTSALTKPAALDVGTELREGYAEVGDVEFVEAGDGPLIVLLHPLPEFWFGWRLQIAPLAAAGFRVVAPDLRGYRPCRRSPTASRLTPPTTWQPTCAISSADVVPSPRCWSVTIWGGTAAWTAAIDHPRSWTVWSILNAAHPRKLNEGLRHPCHSRGPGTSLLRGCRTCPSTTCRRRTGSSSALLARRPAAVHEGGD